MIRARPALHLKKEGGEREGESAARVPERVSPLREKRRGAPRSVKSGTRGAHEVRATRDPREEGEKRPLGVRMFVVQNRLRGESNTSLMMWAASEILRCSYKQ